MRNSRRLKGNWLLRFNKRLLNYNMVFMENNNNLMELNKIWARRLYWFLFWHRALREYVYETGGEEDAKEGKFQWVKCTIAGMSPLDFLDSLFLWDYARRGEKYWRELNKKWVRRWAKYDLRDKSRSKQSVKER